MKKFIMIILSFAIISSLVFSGCKKQEQTLGWGELKNGNYENRYFGYSINVDSSYNFMSPQEIIDMNLRLEDENEDEEDNDKDKLDIRDISDLNNEPILYYLYAFKYPENHEADVNPNISVFSENLDYISGVSNKEAYVRAKMDYIRYVFEGSDYDVTIRKIENVWINDREFARGSVNLSFEGISITQDVYVIVRKNHAIVTMINYSTEEQKVELESFVNTIKIRQ